MKRLTVKEWIESCRKIHGDKYDYSLVKYTNARDKVDVICHEKDEWGNEHGVFSIRACNHSSGTGCPICGKRYQMSKDEFVRKAKQVHGDKYDYSDTVYEKSTKKVEIRCPEHGIFSQVAASHLSGAGCPKCNHGVKYTKETFIERAKEVHGDYYDYSKVVYSGAKTPVEIICPRHGSFLQTPDAHNRGCGCSLCKSSKLEDIVSNRLKKDFIHFEYNSKILELGNQTVDFYLPTKKIIIECQGEQHYNPIKFNITEDDETTNNKLKERKQLDKEKFNKSKKIGLEIIYFTIPKYFNKKTTNIKSGFYKDKHVFTDINELMTYIENTQDNFVNNTLCYSEINSNFNNIFLYNGNELKYKNYVIKVIQFNSPNPRIANEYRIAITKRKYTPIIVFEDEYINHKNIVLSKISHIIGIRNGGIKVGARECYIKPIGKHEAKEFLDENHIQGGSNSTLYYGAFMKGGDNLVGVMSFRLNDPDNMLWELTRFATDNKYIVSGLGSKMFSYFKKNNIWKEVKSFADRRWTVDIDNNLYTKIGFKLDEIEKPDYRYVVGNERKHKFLFRKKMLNKKYGLPLTMTEKEMCNQLGFYRIWDCGLIKYVYKNPNYKEER